MFEYSLVVFLCISGIFHRLLWTPPYHPGCSLFYEAGGIGAWYTSVADRSQATTPHVRDITNARTLFGVGRRVSAETMRPGVSGPTGVCKRRFGNFQCPVEIMHGFYNHFNNRPFKKTPKRNCSLCLAFEACSSVCFWRYLRTGTGASGLRRLHDP